MGLAVALFVVIPAIGLGRFLASRAFGIRGWKEGTQLGVARGRPALAFAQAVGSILCLYVACVTLFVPVVLARGDVRVDESSMRVTVAANGPAERAGIRDGDRIVGVNGERPTDWDHLKKLVGAHPDQTIAVDVERGGATKTFSVDTVGPKMMVGPFVEQRRLGLGEAIGKAVVAPAETAGMALRNLFFSHASGEQAAVSGPVALGRAGPGEFAFLVAAATSTVSAMTAVALLLLAAVTSVVPKRNSGLPTSGNSS